MSDESTQPHHPTPGHADTFPAEAAELLGQLGFPLKETTGSAPAAPRPVVETAEHARPSLAIPGYEILGELGRGGMGVVYKARQLGLNRTVALKMVIAGSYAAGAARARFLLEAESVAALEHPHVVRVFAFGEHGGYPFLVMEYLPGGSLADRMQSGPLLPPRDAAALVAKVASGVAHAHDRGVVHRDIKPGNVLLTADHEPRLTDFGLAKMGGNDLTGTGAVLGTPAYMSPEQAAGKTDEVGPPADVYALGGVLYALLTGRPPFRGDSVGVILQRVLNATPEAPRRIRAEIPRELETVCLKCLEKRPADRYASADQLALDLRRFVGAEAVTARRPGPVLRLWRGARANPAVAGLGTLCAVLLAALVVVASTPADRTEVPATQPPVPAQLPDDDVESLVSELDRAEPGWRTGQSDEPRRVVPPEENSVAVIESVAAALPKSFQDVHTTVYQHYSRDGGPTPLRLPHRTSAQPNLAPALAAARDLLNRPSGQYQTEPRSQNWAFAGQYYGPTDTLASLLAWNALSLASSGDCDAALADCRRLVNVARAANDTPSLGVQGQRIGTGIRAVETALRVLALGEASDRELLALANALRTEEATPLFGLVARGYRAELNRVFELAAAGELGEDKLAVLGSSDALRTIPGGRASRPAHVWALRHANRLVALSSLPPEELAPRLRAWEKAVLTDAPPGAREVLRVGAVEYRRAPLQYTVALREAIAAVAVERYRVSRGRWPETLGELVPEFLPAVPADPDDGAPLGYWAFPRGVVLGATTWYRKMGAEEVNTKDPAAFELTPGARLWNPELRGKAPAP